MARLESSSTRFGATILTSDGKLVNKGTIEAASVKIKSAEGIDNQGGTIRQTQALGLSIAAANLQNAGGTIGAEPVRPPPTPNGNAPGGNGAGGGGSDAGNGAGGAGGAGGNGAGGGAGQGNGAQPVVEEVAPAAPPPATTPGHIETAGTLLNEAGRIYHGGAITLQAQQLNNAGGSIQVSDAALAGAIVNAGGTLSASKRLAINAERIDNTKGTIRAGEALLRAGAVNDVNGANGANIASAADTAIDNRGGSIATTGTLSLEAASIDNTAGLIGAEGAMTLKTLSLVNAGGGRIAGQSSVAIHSKVANGAAIDGDGNSPAGPARFLFDNRGGQVLAGTDLRVEAGVVENAGGSLLANRDLRLDASSFAAEGQIEATRNVGIAVQGDSINRTTVRAGGDLSYSAAGTLTNAGKLTAAQTLDVSAAAIDNTASGDLSGGVTKLRTPGTLTNRGVIDGNDTQIDAASLLNIGTGRIYGDYISIGAGSVRNDTENPPDPGQIVAGRDIKVTGALVNRDSQLIAGGQLVMAPANLVNTPTQAQTIVTSDGLAFFMPADPKEAGIGVLIPPVVSVTTSEVGASRVDAPFGVGGDFVRKSGPGVPGSGPGNPHIIEVASGVGGAAVVITRDINSNPRHPSRNANLSCSHPSVRDSFTAASRSAPATGPLHR
ncbi:hypothetical protein VARIO8X_150161 [Burkholderiales bacterium 8X]|nr:hypothetical protein VARIO8X_150161 [Burkholderiales bacterium 8X]